MTRDTLPLSPLLPELPDWQELALECSRAYFALERVKAAVKQGAADGHDYWQAHSRILKVASRIATWSSDPDLYGRLLAKQRILEEIEHS